MTEPRAVSIWDKIDGPIKRAPQSKSKDETSERSGQSAPRWRRLRWLTADVVGSVLWTYAFAKVFLADFDRWIIDRVAPNLIWLVDFRAFLFMSVLAVILLIFRRKKAWWLVYVMIFPLVIAFWKIPKFYYKRRDWLLLLGSMHVVSTFFRSLRFGLVATTVVILSIVGALASESRYVLVPTAVALLLVWFAVLIQAVRYAVVPSRFVRGQRSLYKRVLTSEQFWTFVSIDQAVKSAEVQTLTQDQTTNVLTKATCGVIAFRAGHFWAYQLDRYRRSGISVLFAVISVSALILQSVITFTFINMALYKMDASQFRFEDEPRIATFVYYAFASGFRSEISALTPAGSWAALVQVVAGLSSGALLLLLIITVFFGIRHSRSDEAATRAIQQMREQSDAFARRLTSEYDLPLDELYARLRYLGAGLVGVISYLTVNMPTTDFNEDGGRDSDAGPGSTGTS